MAVDLPITTHSPISKLFFVMVLVWTKALLFRQSNQPPVLGGLLAGIIWGPSLLISNQFAQKISAFAERGCFAISAELRVKHSLPNSDDLLRS